MLQLEFDLIAPHNLPDGNSWRLLGVQKEK